MGKLTIIDKIKSYLRDRIEYPLLNYLLLRSGFDFGKFYIEELSKMYYANKHKIDRN